MRVVMHLILTIVSRLALRPPNSPKNCFTRAARLRKELINLNIFLVIFEKKLDMVLNPCLKFRGHTGTVPFSDRRNVVASHKRRRKGNRVKIQGVYPIWPQDSPQEVERN